MWKGGIKKMLKPVNLLIVVVIIMICMFSTSTIALANSFKILDPGILPDSPAYELKLILENRKLAALTDSLEKANLHLELADLRLVEAMFMEERGKSQFVNDLVKGYKENLEQAMQNMADALSQGRPVEEALAAVTAATTIHTDILTGLLEQVPEVAIPAILMAIEVSLIGSNVSIVVLEQIAAGELPIVIEPEVLGLPEGIGPSEDEGPPEGIGPSEDEGPPEGIGPSEDEGPPEGIGPSEDEGPPEGIPIGPPGG